MTELKENLLMETAMRIQEVFDEMYYAHNINPDKVDEIDSLERLQIFRNWAREFEDKYHDTERYEEDFIGLSDEFAQKKIKEKFGNEDIVSITCYNKTEKMERSKAIEFYREAANYSEGSERERYVNILFGLMDGLNEVYDDEEGGGGYYG